MGDIELDRFSATNVDGSADNQYIVFTFVRSRAIFWFGWGDFTMTNTLFFFVQT